MREIYVRESFDNKSVVITGATGLLGKVLLEKLLRSCQGVKNIFILIRSKKDGSINERFEELKSSIAFDRLKEIDPKLISKLHPLKYSLTDENFGLLKDEIELLQENCNYVFHCSASVKFTEPIEDAIKINTIGTQNLISLIMTFKNLEAFVHVSTAYSNVHEQVIEEKIYHTIFDYKDMIDVLNNSSTSELKSTTKHVLSVFPNTYIFSKHLAERLVCDFSEV